MNLQIAKEFQEILNKHFNFLDHKLSADTFEKNWDSATQSHSRAFSKNDIELLLKIKDEISEIIIHMPAENLLSNKLDWKKWTKEEGFLQFILLRQIIQQSISATDLDEMLKGVLKETSIPQPFRNDNAFVQSVDDYINFFISSKSKKFQRYKNLGGNSNVSKYEISSDSIIVEFNDGSQYLYNYRNPGHIHVEHMKKLAMAGQGLNSYISTTVRKNFAKKLC